MLNFSDIRLTVPMLNFLNLMLKVTAPVKNLKYGFNHILLSGHESTSNYDWFSVLTPLSVVP